MTLTECCFRRVSTSMILAATILPGLLAQRSEPHIDPGARRLMRSPDYIFGLRAYQGALAEVRMAELIPQKTSDAELKSFGQRVVREHGKAADELKGLAEKAAMTLPAQLTVKDQAEVDKLERLSDAAFVKEYLHYLIKTHADDIKHYQKETKDGREEPLKAFAARTLPMLQAHLDALKAMQNRMK